MARCAVRAAYQRRNVWRNWHVRRDSLRPPLRGRGHRSATSTLTVQNLWIIGQEACSLKAESVYSFIEIE
jgi:hypothetical protein